MRGLYQISNTITGDFYVGSGRDIACRRNHHFWSLRRGKHHNQRLQRAWNKYGESAFEFRVLAILEVDELYPTEERLLSRVVGRNDCYNNNRSTAGGRLGIPHTAETRAKIGAASTRRVVTDETRAKLRNNFKGRTHTAETRAKCSAAQARRPRTSPSLEQREKIRQSLKGRTLAPEHVARVAASHRGKKRSPETRAKMALAATGKTHTPETRALLSAQRKGKRLSPEHRNKIVAAIIGRRHSEETKQKMRAAALRRSRLADGTFADSAGG